MPKYATRPLKIVHMVDLLTIHHVLKKILEQPTPLNNYKTGCDSACGECPVCMDAKTTAARILTHPQTRTWEVWRRDPVDFVGILMLSGVDPGRDATAHFKFFDDTLRDKKEVLQSWFDWAFEEYDLRRISLEIPHYAFATISFAHRLGFGGDFKYQQFHVEGRKRAVLEDGDLILMGKIRNGARS